MSRPLPSFDDMSAVMDFSIPPPPPILCLSQDDTCVGSQSLPPPLAVQDSCPEPCSQLALPATPTIEHDGMETGILVDQPNTSPVVCESPGLSTRASTPTLPSSRVRQLHKLRVQCREYERRIAHLENEIAMRKEARDKTRIETEKQWLRMNRFHEDYCSGADTIADILIFQVDYLERDLEARDEQVSTCAPDPSTTPYCEFKALFGQASYVLRNHLGLHRLTRMKFQALETESHVMNEQNKHLRQLIRDKGCDRPDFMSFTDIDME